MASQIVRSSLPSFSQKRFGLFVLVEVSCTEVSTYLSSPEFLKGFSKAELHYAQKLAKGDQSLSARYAAKQAAATLSSLPWQSFEILRSPEGVPSLVLRPEADYPCQPLLVSLTHDGDRAAAYVGWKSTNVTLPKLDEYEPT